MEQLVCQACSRIAEYNLDTELLNGTFHPEAEEHFRTKPSPKELKKVQWKRIPLALHYCNKLSNNARVFLGWTL